jgi:hypothetical protein
MPGTYLPTSRTTTVQAPAYVDGRMAAAERDRLAKRAGLRSCTRSLLRELSEQHDHSGTSAGRALVARRMQDLRDELVEALRGDPAAIESLSVKNDDPTEQ